MSRWLIFFNYKEEQMAMLRHLRIGPNHTTLRRSPLPSTCSSYSSTSRKNGGDIDDNASSSKKSPKSPPSFSRESTLDSSLANKFGGDAIKKPPFQSLHKAIIAGEVCMPPLQRVRKNGKVITTFSVATGGMWRLPLPSKVTESSNPENECTDSCIQYHKVAIHDEGLGRLAVRTLRKGMLVYVEGELEIRVFNDADTGVIKRDREVAVHVSGQILALNHKGAVPIVQ